MSYKAPDWISSSRREQQNACKKKKRKENPYLYHRKSTEKRIKDFSKKTQAHNFSIRKCKRKSSWTFGPGSGLGVCYQKLGQQSRIKQGKPCPAGGEGASVGREGAGRAGDNMRKPRSTIHKGLPQNHSKNQITRRRVGRGLEEAAALQQRHKWLTGV